MQDCEHLMSRVSNYVDGRDGFLCMDCGNAVERHQGTWVIPRMRLSRHQKQAVRRFIRREARRHNRNHKGTRGSVAGVRLLINAANREMGWHGREAVVMYPQDVGCGVSTVTQILSTMKEVN